MAEREVLEELGFTKREIKVYLAMLELGSSTVGPIASRAGLQHSKVYETLDKLMKKGLASYVVVSKTKHFQPSDPKEILNVIEERKRKFNEILEDLERRQKAAQTRQIAVVHEGFKAYKAMFNRILDELTPKDYYWAFAFRQEYNNPTASLFLRNVHEKLAKKKIEDRLLGHISMRKMIKKTFVGNRNIEIRYTKNETPLGTLVLKGRVIPMLWGENPTSIEIISDQVHEQYRNFFRELWENAKE